MSGRSSLDSVGQCDEHQPSPERPRILAVTLRRLGDVLLTTPLIRTIRRGFPRATLDVLAFRGSDAS